MLHGTDIIPWNIFIFSLNVENFYEKNTHLRPIYACCILQCKMWSKLAPFTKSLRQIDLAATQKVSLC